MLQQGTRTKYETGDLMSAAREGCNHVTLSIWQDRWDLHAAAMKPLQSHLCRRLGKF